MTNAAGNGREPGWVPDVNSLGARLALVRQAMGWNIAEAAVNCDIPIASWRNWESRGKEPRGLLNVAMKIAGVTGVDYRWLALGPAEQPRERSTEADRVTHGYDHYHSLGERVIAVGRGSGVPSSVRPDPRTGVRTRPLER